MQVVEKVKYATHHAFWSDMVAVADERKLAQVTNAIRITHFSANILNLTKPKRIKWQNMLQVQTMISVLNLLWVKLCKQKSLDVRCTLFGWIILKLTLGKENFRMWRAFNTGVLISPEPDLLPDVFCLTVRIFLLKLVLLYINSTNIPQIVIINRLYENQNLLSP